MTCRRFKKGMVMNIYGEQEERARLRLQRHLSRCAACREEHEATRRALDALSSVPAKVVPEVDWERQWSAIEAGLKPARPRAGFLAALPRWAYAPLALAVLFGLGIAVGRYLLPRRPMTPYAFVALPVSPAAEQAMLGRYFEDVKPVLMDYSHNGITSRTEGLILTDREIARSLLVQNLLLKRALARKDPQLADLLDDLSLILTEIANIQGGDTATSASLKSIISQRQILSRIRSREKI